MLAERGQEELREGLWATQEQMAPVQIPEGEEEDTPALMPEMEDNPELEEVQR